MYSPYKKCLILSKRNFLQVCYNIFQSFHFTEGHVQRCKTPLLSPIQYIYWFIIGNLLMQVIIKDTCSIDRYSNNAVQQPLVLGSRAFIGSCPSRLCFNTLCYNITQKKSDFPIPWRCLIVFYRTKLM